MRTPPAGSSVASQSQPSETWPSPCRGAEMSTGLFWEAIWALTWALSGDGVGLDLFLQEGTHTGPVLQVSGQGGIPCFKEGLWGQAATAALIPGMLEEGCSQKGLIEV